VYSMTNSFALFIKPVFLPVVIEGSLGLRKIQSYCQTAAASGDKAAGWLPCKT
jgi:hypothetical protein